MSVSNVSSPPSIPPLGSSNLSPAEASVQALAYLGYLSLLINYLQHPSGSDVDKNLSAAEDEINSLVQEGGILSQLLALMPTGAAYNLVQAGLAEMNLPTPPTSPDYSNYTAWLTQPYGSTGQPPLAEASTLIGGASALYVFNANTSPNTIFAVIMFYLGLNQEQGSSEANSQLAALLGQWNQGFSASDDLGIFLSLYVHDSANASRDPSTDSKAKIQGRPKFANLVRDLLVNTESTSYDSAMVSMYTTNSTYGYRNISANDTEGVTDQTWISSRIDTYFNQNPPSNSSPVSSSESSGAPTVHSSSASAAAPVASVHGRTAPSPTVSAAVQGAHERGDHLVRSHSGSEAWLLLLQEQQQESALQNNVY